jgi:MSHA biogenesis protein MshJ
MQARWKGLIERFAALSARERILILVALFAVAYQLADLVVLDRQYRQVEQLNREIAQDNAAIVRLNGELNVLSTQARHDPNSALREHIAQAREHVDQLQSRLASATGGMISPRDMARFLEELLLQEGELEMLRLQSLEAQPLLPVASDDMDEAEPARPLLHRHGFEIEFAGGYMATLRYLQALESLPWRFFWDSVDYQVTAYPQSTVRLKLYTLSLSEDWIGV